MGTLPLNVYGSNGISGYMAPSTIQVSRKSQVPFEEVEVENPVNLQDGNYKDPRFDTFTPSGDVLNLHDLPENWPGYHSAHFGNGPIEQDPNIIDNTRYDGKTKIIDPDTHYYGYEVETSKSSLHRHFYNADFDFLYEAAEEYAKIESYQDYRNDPTDTLTFVGSMLDFLNDGKYETKVSEEWQQFVNAVENHDGPGGETIYWTDADGNEQSRFVLTAVAEYKQPENQELDEWSQLQVDLKAVARELAERMKNGESTDLESLETTITIKGAQFKMSEVKELQELCKAFESLSPEHGRQLYGHASLGLAKTMGSLIADKYADKSEEFVSALESAFHKTADYYLEKLYKNDTTIENPFNSNRANTGAKVADMFASLDTSSREALEKSYQEQRAQFGEILSGYTSYMGHLSESKGVNLAQVDESFQKLLNAIYPE